MTWILMMLLLLPLSGAWGDPDAGSPLLWPGPPAPPRVRFLQSFLGPQQLGLEKGRRGGLFRRLLFGKEDARMVRPYGIAVSSDGDVICVADSGAGAVHVFDRRSGRYVTLREADGQELLSPVGVALGDDGSLFVSDSERQAVFVFSPRLKFRFAFGSREGIQRPTGIATHEDRLFVVDTAASRVLVFQIGESSARRVQEIGERGNGPGQLNFPVDIAISSRDRIYVNDSMNFRIQVFDLEGNHVGSVGGPGDSTGHFQRPKGVAVGIDEDLYVVDALFDTVQVFDSSARFLLDFGSSGAADGQFWLPTGLAIDGSGRIYVVDSSNQRVQIFQFLEEAADGTS